ncbi:PTS IIA-like nitrogen regulatory protein PtsN [Motilimonas eburnea]|uniref:PTS IIA-like nitrogen regulatory protein PtsN n=1 Tax=Motilimonas eburnea TaxID=1737488 RepID=UPI001E4AF48E|nr:PTS IIA-like nitrogen regulatory protein PtsN [Motilimonas eburnea]MCE2572107.1 PTS IIA-like nitrogen regulatory protein PtsN [Motilimonas eburnea]
MQINQLLTQDCTLSAVSCSSKKKALEIISELAADKLSIDAKLVFENLLTRERLGTTGVGCGIAIPHARISDDYPVTGIFIQCESPIDYSAIDNQPVDLLFAVLVPESQCSEHLKTLSLIAGKLSDKQVCRQLRAAKTDAELFDVICTS